MSDRPETCQVFEEAIVPYLDGELPPEERNMVDAHLARCAACRGVVEEYRRLNRLLGELPVAPPTSVVLRVAAAQRRVRIRERVGRVASWAAAVLIVAAGGGFGYWLAPGTPAEPELTENWGVFQEIAALEQVGGEDVADDPAIVHAVYELAQEAPFEEY